MRREDRESLQKGLLDSFMGRARSGNSDLERPILVRKQASGDLGHPPSRAVRSSNN